MTPDTGLTPREVTLLLTIFEQEAENARLIEEKWERATVDDAEDENNLEYERAFASGVRNGANHALTIFRNAIA